MNVKGCVHICGPSFSINQIHLDTLVTLLIKAMTIMNYEYIMNIVIMRCLVLVIRTHGFSNVL